MGGNKITAIILAAGQGKRMNTPVAKQFLTLGEKPVLYYSLKAFVDSSVDEIILVTGDGQEECCRENIVKRYQLGKVTQVIAGGKERYDSVYAALSCIKQTDYVLIHDGARPFISVQLIEHTIEAVKKYKACILGTPVKETIKIVNGDGFIASTPERSFLWSAQTPQAFEYEGIRKVHELLQAEEETKRRNVTDDAMLYEAYLNKPVKLIMGDYNNIKLTTPEDMIHAESLYKILFPENK